MKKQWVPHHTRDTIVDYLKYWNKRSNTTIRQLLAWLELGTSKYHDWKKRYGKANEHNGKIPRDYWLEHVDHYNNVRLHSAIGYVTPADKLAGCAGEINASRDRRLETARAKRKEKRNAQVASQAA